VVNLCEYLVKTFDSIPLERNRRVCEATLSPFSRLKIGVDEKTHLPADRSLRNRFRLSLQQSLMTAQEVLQLGSPCSTGNPGVAKIHDVNLVVLVWFRVHQSVEGLYPHHQHEDYPVPSFHVWTVGSNVFVCTDESGFLRNRVEPHLFFQLSSKLLPKGQTDLVQTGRKTPTVAC